MLIVGFLFVYLAKINHIKIFVMGKYTLPLVGAGLLALITSSSFFIKVDVRTSIADSMIDKYVKKHPKSEDKKTGVRKVPLFYYILSKKS